MCFFGMLACILLFSSQEPPAVLPARCKPDSAFDQPVSWEDYGTPTPDGTSLILSSSQEFDKLLELLEIMLNQLHGSPSDPVILFKASIMSAQLYQAYLTQTQKLSTPSRVLPSLLNLDSFLEPQMRRRFELMPSPIITHVNNSAKLYTKYFSQAAFDNIFVYLAPVLLRKLETMDNTSWDSGCQDRANIFVINLQNCYKKLSNSPLTISVQLRNFFVLNYLLGCSQERIGKGTFLNCTFPEQREKFRFDDWFPNCVSAKTIEYLKKKRVESFAAQTAALVSAINKAYFLPPEQLSKIGYTNKFGILIAKSSHADSFRNMARLCKTEKPGFVDIVWTHIQSASTTGVVHATYTFSSPVNAQQVKTGLFGYVVQLLSLNLSDAEKEAIETHVQSLEGLFQFMDAWGIYTDGDSQSAVAGSFSVGDSSLSEVKRIKLLHGKLDRKALLRLINSSNFPDEIFVKPTGVSVKHILALTCEERRQLPKNARSWLEQDDLTQPFPLLNQDVF
jgi:hypothetical protein